MHTHGHGGDGPSMSQMIFNIGLPVETISVYLLACGLTDAGNAVTSKNLADVWNGTAEALNKGLRDLEARNILTRIISDGEDKVVYSVNAADKWKLS